MNTDLEMEEIDCPICEQSRGDPLHLEGSFQMVRCSSCQFIFLNPRPTAESLHHFYQTYLPEEESSIESWKRMMKPVFHRAANLLKRYGRNGRLLDVGSGFGFFVAEMKKKGWEAAGVEISQKALEYARNVLGLTVHPDRWERRVFPIISSMLSPLFMSSSTFPPQETFSGNAIEFSNQEDSSCCGILIPPPLRSSSIFWVSRIACTICLLISPIFRRR